MDSLVLLYNVAFGELKKPISMLVVDLYLHGWATSSHFLQMKVESEPCAVLISTPSRSGNMMIKANISPQKAVRQHDQNGVTGNTRTHSHGAYVVWLEQKRAVHKTGKNNQFILSGDASPQGV